MTAEWNAVAEFLAVNKAMGRVGAVLAEGAAGRQEVQLRVALQDAMARLQHLAQAVGIDLWEER